MSPVAIRVARRVKALWEAMRPHHWIKNLVVFAAPLFALALNAGVMLRVGWAFVGFSMTASAFYLINDVRDIEEDRKHPVKQHRPIPAGLLPIPVAITAAILLLAAGLVGSYFVAPWLAFTIGAYALIQAGYNLGLKEEPIIDIMVIAGGFVLRALGGAAAAGVPVSGWFVLCIGLLAFFLGIEKRKAELCEVEEESKRSVLETYTLSWLQRMEGVVTASALMAYALWTLEGTDTPWMLGTLPFVGYGIFRYQYLSESMNVERPENVLVEDKKIVTNTVVWLIVSLLLIYMK